MPDQTSMNENEVSTAENHNPSDEKKIADDKNKTSKGEDITPKNKEEIIADNEMPKDEKPFVGNVTKEPDAQ